MNRTTPHSKAVSHRRQPRKLRITRAMVLIATVLWAPRAMAQQVTVTPTSGPGGTVVTATSSGFDKNHVGYNTGFYVGIDETHLSFISGCPGPAGTDAWANCSINVTIPGATGPYVVVAFNSNGEHASTSFEALTPSLTISPTCGPNNTASILVTGQRWAVGYDAGLYVDGGLVRAGNYPTSGGSFTQTLTGPSANGSHTITAANSVGQLQSDTFTTPICTTIGNITDLQGSAQVTHADGSTTPLSIGDPVKLGDTISVGSRSRLDVTHDDETTLTLSEQTTLTFDQHTFDPSTNEGNTFTRALQGSFEYVSGLIGHHQNPDNQVIQLQSLGGIGIRGTTFITQIGAASAEVDLLNGSVDISPFETLATKTYTGPVKIVFDTHGSTGSAMTEDEYNAIRDGLFPPASSDSTPPLVTVSFPTAPVSQLGFFNASQVPVGGSVSAADSSNVTVISCADTLSGLTAGTTNGINTPSAGRALSLSGDGTHVVSCTATDGESNAGASTGSVNTATVKIDATRPTVSYASHPASYSVDQTIAITCTATDLLSGLAPNTNTCQNVSGAAYTFSLGLHTYNATATDKAGNIGTGSTQFTVVDTYDGLIALVNSFETKASVAATLVSTLRSAQSAAAARNVNSANNQLSAFVNQVQAQSGKSLTADQAATLVRLATALKM